MQTLNNIEKVETKWLFHFFRILKTLKISRIFFSLSIFIFLNVKANDTIRNLDLIPKMEGVFYLHDETHGLSSEGKIDIQLLEFYILERNVSNITLEIGHATAYLANQYLETGNPEWLCKIGPNKIDHEFTKLLKKLREIRKDHDNIQFVGIDVKNFIADWIYSVHHILNKMTLDNSALMNHYTFMDSILQFYAQINQSNFTQLNSEIASRVQLYQLKRNVRDFFSKNSIIFQEELSEKDFHSLKYILTSDKDFYGREEDRRNGNTNKHWIDNIHDFIKLDLEKEGNFYGKFGSSHIRYGISGNGTFSKLLNESKYSKFYKKVVLCNTAYLDSYYLTGYEKAIFNKKNNFTYYYPKEVWKKLKNKKYWFHQRKLMSKSKCEVVQRSFRKFPASFIIYIRDDCPSPDHRKFCGDDGW